MTLSQLFRFYVSTGEDANKVGRMWKKEVTARHKVLSQHFSGGTEKPLSEGNQT